MSLSTSIARVFGIPIRVHFTLWLLLPVIALSLANSLFWGLIIAVGLFASVALHELGHSLIAIKKGCRVREILLLPIGGMAQMDKMPAKPADEILIAIAGPLVSLLLFAMLTIIGHICRKAGLGNLAALANTLGGVNLILGIFNLLPSFPMDGGRVFRALLTPRVGKVRATQLATTTGRIIAVIFGFIGLLTLPYGLNLIVIGIFIYIAAGAEYRAVQYESKPHWQPHSHQWGREPQQCDVNDSEITVGPPPYERKDNGNIGP